MGAKRTGSSNRTVIAEGPNGSKAKKTAEETNPGFVATGFVATNVKVA